MDYYPATEQISDIGGLDNLKDWLLKRGTAFSEKARQYGLPHPRGLLLIGIQGTGKSLTAKAIAHHWHLPLLRLDVGRLFGGLVGESESRTRQMIQLAEALAPCVLWIDEIDKAFGGLGGQGDSGTTSRVFWYFHYLDGLKRPPPCLSLLPLTIFRLCPQKCYAEADFDENFLCWSCQTNRSARPFFEVHLSHLRPHTLKHFDLSRLAYETPDFSGAENRAG